MFMLAIGNLVLNLCFYNRPGNNGRKILMLDLKLDEAF